MQLVLADVLAGLLTGSPCLHNGASPVALLRASFFFAASADDGAEDLALGAVAVGLKELDVAVDEDALALLESVERFVSKLFVEFASFCR